MAGETLLPPVVDSTIRFCRHKKSPAHPCIDLKGMEQDCFVRTKFRPGFSFILSGKIADIL